MPEEYKVPDLDLERNSGAPSDGWHLFKVDRISATPPGQAGYVTVVVNCICQDQGPDKGLSCAVWLNQSPQSRWVQDNFLDALEMPRVGKTSWDSTRGKIFKGKVSSDEWEGTIRTKITAFLRTSQAIPGAKTSVRETVVPPVRSEEDVAVPQDDQPPLPLTNAPEVPADTVNEPKKKVTF